VLNLFQNLKAHRSYFRVVHWFLILFSRRDIPRSPVCCSVAFVFAQYSYVPYNTLRFRACTSVRQLPLPAPVQRRLIAAMDNASVPQHTHVQEHTEGTTFAAIHPNRDHTHRDDDSVRTASITDSTARNSANNEKGYSNVTGGVDIQRAEADFAELSKELSRASNLARRLSRVQSKHSRKGDVVADVEKAAVEGSEASDEPFDLEATLRGSKDEEEAAGIKSKRIGVMWDGLTVSGIGMPTLHHLHAIHALTVA
jgi:hypothetical protein